MAGGRPLRPPHQPPSMSIPTTPTTPHTPNTPALNPTYLTSISAVHPRTGFRPGQWDGIMPLGSQTPIGTYGNTGPLACTPDGTPLFGQDVYNQALQELAAAGLQPGGVTPAVLPATRARLGGVLQLQLTGRETGDVAQGPKAGEIPLPLETPQERPQPQPRHVSFQDPKQAPQQKSSELETPQPQPLPQPLQQPVQQPLPDPTQLPKQKLKLRPKPPPVNILAQVHATHQAALQDPDYLPNLLKSQNPATRTNGRASFIPPPPRIDLRRHPRFGLHTYGNPPRIDGAAPAYLYERSPMQYLPPAGKAREQQYRLAAKARKAQEVAARKRDMERMQQLRAVEEEKMRSVVPGMGVDLDPRRGSTLAETSSGNNSATTPESAGPFRPLISHIRGGLPMPANVGMKDGKRVVPSAPRPQHAVLFQHPNSSGTSTTPAGTTPATSTSSYKPLITSIPAGLAMPPDISPGWQKPYLTKAAVQTIPAGSVPGARPNLKSNAARHSSAPLTTPKIEVKNEAGYFDSVLTTLDQKLGEIRPNATQAQVPAGPKRHSAPAGTYYPKTNDPHAPRSDAGRKTSGELMPPPPPRNSNSTGTETASYDDIPLRALKLHLDAKKYDDVPLSVLKQRLEAQKRAEIRDGKRPMVAPHLSTSAVVPAKNTGGIGAAPGLRRSKGKNAKRPRWEGKGSV
ncbi:hypothetical protein EDC01DRAFT_774992 [Geopyxis carbonaria]|nr:hypothetical protein EDC01DRAFT_774992 [Geopyxis carbonaria]